MLWGESVPDIVAIGECLIELFSDKPIGTAESFQKSLAGDTLNMLVMASRLGSSCGYITRVGDDPFADYMVDTWRNLNIDTAAVRRGPGFTGVHFISLLPGGEREFIYYRRGSATSTMTADDIDPGYITQARVLHVSAILQAVSESCRDAVLQAVKIARDSGVVVSYDTNLRLNIWTIDEAREAMDDVLPYVDIVFPSHPEETKLLLGAGSPEDAIEVLHARGIGTVALKSGNDGAWVSTGNGVSKIGAVAPNGVADTTGAGDAFVGGFLHCLESGLGALEGARWGVAAAGLKVAGRGGIASQPVRDEVESILSLVQVDGV